MGESAPHNQFFGQGSSKNSNQKDPVTWSTARAALSAQGPASEMPQDHRMILRMMRDNASGSSH